MDRLYPLLLWDQGVDPLDRLNQSGQDSLLFQSTLSAHFHLLIQLIRLMPSVQPVLSARLIRLCPLFQLYLKTRWAHCLRLRQLSQ